MAIRKIFCEVVEGTVWEDRCLFKLSKVIENNKSCENCILHEVEKIKSCGAKKEVPERRKKKKVRAKGSHQAKKNIPSAGLLKIPEGEAEPIKDSPQITKQLYSVRDLISLLEKSERTIREWAEKGKIPAQKVGKQWHFKKEEIDLWVSGKGKNIKGQELTVTRTSREEDIHPSDQNAERMIDDSLNKEDSDQIPKSRFVQGNQVETEK